MYRFWKFATKSDLERGRSLESDGFKFERSLPDEYWQQLDPETPLAIESWATHEQPDGPFATVVRCDAWAPADGQPDESLDDREMVELTFDLPAEIFEELPGEPIEIDD